MTDNDLESIDNPREQEFQDRHYHDDDLEIQQDDMPNARHDRPGLRKKPVRRPPPRRRYVED